MVVGWFAMMAGRHSRVNAGLHDPYWYEAFVGLTYVVKLLDPESGVLGVKFQASDVEGVDDVVVRREDGVVDYIQVKHTRADQALTVRDLCRQSGGSGSLLETLARGWLLARERNPNCHVVLFSNRKASPGRNDPPLPEFWNWLRGALREAEPASIVPPSEMQAAWADLRQVLGFLDDRQFLAFVNAVEIKLDQSDSDRMEEDIQEELARIFGVERSRVETIFHTFKSKLSVWTTSRRTVEEVTAEVVYEALQLNEQVGDHEIPPPDPLFGSRRQLMAELETALREEDGNGVHFLVGPAGCGKTSLVSALASQPDSPIDLRFHVFRPILPGDRELSMDWGSRTASASALWGDLLAQLRAKFFQGKLAQYRVPVRNELLLDDLNRLQQEVLRLAQELARTRGRPTVIAIDGLDHALRARMLRPEILEGQPSVLDSLVPPDRCPGGVVFLIAGQPNSQHPGWLRSDGRGVRRWEVPGLPQEDVEQQLAKALPDLDGTTRTALARIIMQHTGGNTLAVVFAVEEVKETPEPPLIGDRLKSRRLGSDLDEYYRTVWEGALGAAKATPGASSCLAGALILSSSRLTGDRLERFFGGATGLRRADWNRVLGELRPLLVEDSAGWRVQHNDVRVFLHGQLDSAQMADVASSMADGHLARTETQECHQDLFRLLKLAGRHQDGWELFGPSWVAEAARLGRPIEEVYDDAAVVLRFLKQHVSSVPWEKLHQFALGLMSVLQWERMLLEEPEDSGNLTPGGVSPPMPPFLTSEGVPADRSRWTVDLINEVLSEVESLLTGGEVERARGVLRRWFDGIPPRVLATDLVHKEKRSRPGDGEVIELLKRLGELHRAACLVPTWERGEGGSAETAFWSGWLVEGARRDDLSWQDTFVAGISCFPEHFIEAMRLLEKAERIDDLFFSLERIDPYRDETLYELIALAAAWTVEHRKVDGAARRFLDSVHEQRFEEIPQIKVWDREAEPYDAVAFALGWLEPHCSPMTIAEEGLKAYRRKNPYSSRTGSLRRLVYVAAAAGRTLRLCGKDGGSSFDAALPPFELKTILQVAFDRTRRGGIPLGEAHQLMAKRLGLILESARSAGRKTQDLINGSLLTYDIESPCDDLTLLVLRELERRRQYSRLEEWLEHWLGTSGILWQEDPTTRASILQAVRSSLQDARWESVLGDAEERHRRSRIGYASHKDYSLEEPLAWFLAAAREDPKVWESYGLRLFRASWFASKTGDNRYGREIGEEVATAAARCGPEALWRLACVISGGEHDDSTAFTSSLLDGISGLAECQTLDDQDAAAIWCLALGVESPERRQGRSLFQRLEEALQLRDSRSRYIQHLLDISHAEFQAAFWKEELAEETAPDSGEEATERKDLTYVLDDLERRVHRRPDENDRWASLWSEVHSLSKRMAREPHGDMDEFCERLLKLVISEMGEYPWYFDGCDKAIENLVPLLSEQQRRRLLSHTLERISLDRDRKVWAKVASSDLKAISRYVAETPQETEAGLDRALRCHEMWWEDLPGLPPFGAAEVSVPQGVSTWSGLAVRALMDHLESRCAERLHRAMRGLWLLTVMETDVGEALLRRWEDLSPFAREKGLLLAERVAYGQDIDRAPWVRLVELGTADTSATVLLQAWAAAQSLRLHGIGVETSTLAPLDASVASSPVIVPGGILTGTGSSDGLLTFANESSALTEMIKRLAAATGESATRIEQAFLAWERTPATPDEPSSSHPKTCWEQDAAILALRRSESFVAWAWQQARRGFFGDDPFPALAQSLLHSDDPWILTGTPSPAPDASAWPVDDELDDLVASGKNILQERLAIHFLAGLAETEIIIGGLLATFSRKHDVSLELFVTWGSSMEVGPTPAMPMTFNGRSTWFYGSPPYEPSLDLARGSLLARTGGLTWYRMWPLVPLSFWRTRLGWKPSMRDPRVWVRDDGEEVARLEAFHGPYRDMIQDRFLRQPTLFRWICSRRAVEDAAKALGVKPREALIAAVRPHGP